MTSFLSYRLLTPLLACGIGFAAFTPLSFSQDAPEQTTGDVGHLERRELNVEPPMPYLLFVPEDYKESSLEKRPLMIFLHGAGERKGDLSKVAKHGPPFRINEDDSFRREFPFIMAAPQTTKWWPHDDQMKNVREIIDALSEEFRVDESRIYITGLSMGGMGTWKMLALYPDLFAAAAPICGKANLKFAPDLVDVPIWAFHGEKDTTVPPSGSIEIVDAIKAAGGEKVKLTLYPDEAHMSWISAYEDPELYEWLLSHTRE